MCEWTVRGEVNRVCLLKYSYIRIIHRGVSIHWSRLIFLRSFLSFDVGLATAAAEPNNWTSLTSSRHTLPDPIHVGNSAAEQLKMQDTYKRLKLCTKRRRLVKITWSVSTRRLRTWGGLDTSDHGVGVNTVTLTAVCFVVHSTSALCTDVR